MKHLYWCFLLFSAVVMGQENGDDWSDEWGDDWDEAEQQAASPWSATGFLEWAYGERFDRDALFTDQTTLSEFRWQQVFDYEDEAVDFKLGFDVWLDDVAHGLQFDLREFNFKFSSFSQTDVVLGRQVVTWGTGDLLFVNDLFAKDWVSFFSGRDDSYLKAPVDAIRLTSYFKPFNVDWVLMPETVPDRFINGERFALFSPAAQSLIGGAELLNPRNSRQPAYALRLFKNQAGHQLALYAYHGTDPSPQGVDFREQLFFPRKNVYGGSYQTAFGQGLYRLEVGYHQARDDRMGSHPGVPNSQWRVLLGYERELIKNLNWGMQYYQERISQYDRLLAASPNPQFEPRQQRQVITQRLTYQAMQSQLTWSLFVFYSPSDHDAYWRPAVNYRHNDQWQWTLGANVFHGQEQHSFFGQFEQASNAYMRVRFYF